MALPTPLATGPREQGGRSGESQGDESLAVRGESILNPVAHVPDVLAIASDPNIAPAVASALKPFDIDTSGGESEAAQLILVPAHAASEWRDALEPRQGLALRASSTPPERISIERDDETSWRQALLHDLSLAAALAQRAPDSQLSTAQMRAQQDMLSTVTGMADLMYQGDDSLMYGVMTLEDDALRNRIPQVTNDIVHDPVLIEELNQRGVVRVDTHLDLAGQISQLARTYDLFDAVVEFESVLERISGEEKRHGYSPQTRTALSRIVRRVYLGFHTLRQHVRLSQLEGNDTGELEHYVSSKIAQMETHMGIDDTGVYEQKIYTRSPRRVKRYGTRMFGSEPADRPIVDAHRNILEYVFPSSVIRDGDGTSVLIPELAIPERQRGAASRAVGELSWTDLTSLAIEKTQAYAAQELFARYGDKLLLSPDGAARVHTQMNRMFGVEGGSSQTFDEPVVFSRLVAEMGERLDARYDGADTARTNPYPVWSGLAAQLLGPISDVWSRLTDRQRQSISTLLPVRQGGTVSWETLQLLPSVARRIYGSDVAEQPVRDERVSLPTINELRKEPEFARMYLEDPDGFTRTVEWLRGRARHAHTRSGRLDLRGFGEPAELEPMNVTYFGHSGSGKTQGLIPHLAPRFGFEIFRAKATDITPKGYHGPDIDDVGYRLVRDTRRSHPDWTDEQVRHHVQAWTIVMWEEASAFREKPGSERTAFEAPASRTQYDLAAAVGSGESSIEIQAPRGADPRVLGTITSLNTQDIPMMVVSDLEPHEIEVVITKHLIDAGEFDPDMDVYALLSSLAPHEVPDMLMELGFKPPFANRFSQLLVRGRVTAESFGRLWEAHPRDPFAPQLKLQYTIAKELDCDPSLIKLDAGIGEVLTQYAERVDNGYRGYWSGVTRLQQALVTFLQERGMYDGGYPISAEMARAILQ